MATALSSLAQQPDASSTITRTLFVGLAMIESLAIYCFVVSMILIFANPFWTNAIAQPGESEPMLIDWFTVGAQALNFLVLVWLLKHFLYKPILDAIDARAKGIAATLADADAKTKEAQKQHDDFEGKNKAFDEQRAALLRKATDEARTEHDRLIDEAHKEADGLRAAQAAALKSDLATAEQGNHPNRLREVFAIARKTLADLATASLEERVGAVFTLRLGEMDGKAKRNSGCGAEEFRRIGRSAEAPSTCPRTRGPPFRMRSTKLSPADIRVRFEAAPDRICGIELTANGQKVGWSIAEYLTSLDQKVGALLDAQQGAK